MDRKGHIPTLRARPKYQLSSDQTAAPAAVQWLKHCAYGPMRGLGTDHVISVPMRGANTHTQRQTDRHRNSKTTLAQWANTVKIK